MVGLKPTRLDRQKIQHRPAHDRERSPSRNVCTNHAWVSTTFRSCQSFALAAVSEPDPKGLLPSAGTAWVVPNGRTPSVDAGPPGHGEVECGRAVARASRGNLTHYRTKNAVSDTELAAGIAVQKQAYIGLK